ncbi:MAG: hypothetical protein ACI8QS_000780, partial [Planctomycetota bacterium]
MLAGAMHPAIHSESGPPLPLNGCFPMSFVAGSLDRGEPESSSNRPIRTLGISSTKNAPPPPAPLINMLTSTLSLIAAGLLASGATVGPQTGVSQATGQSS